MNVTRVTLLAGQAGLRSAGIRLVFAGLLALGLAVPALAEAAPASPSPGPCVDSVLPGGALAKICVPAAGWNGDLVLYAHGYVPAGAPLAAYEAQLSLPDGTYLPALLQSLGYAFATTSYRTNGLAILPALEDLQELHAQFSAQYGQPGHTYLTGVSEGGLITALAVEQAPGLYDGGLATCGPLGDFRRQTDYFGDFRVLFDYFFPGTLPPTAISIPTSVMLNWETVYVPLISARLAQDPLAAAALLRTSNAAFDTADLTTIGQTTLGVLWYNVFATNDATAKLGGSPFDNINRWYSGSRNDLRLNRLVARFSASPAAVSAMADYQTSGHLTVPLVAMHTTGDEIVPYGQARTYANKVQTSGAGRFTLLPIQRYGHCNFTSQEVVTAFAVLVLQVTGQPLP